MEVPSTRCEAVGAFDVLPDRLGMGAFGYVATARHRHSREKVATRVITKRSLLSDLHRERVSRSVQLLRTLRHNHILRMVRLTETPNKVYVFAELARTDLLTLLRQRGRLGATRVRCYMQQLLSALSFCHSHNVVHRNLKLEHVLVMPDGVLKLTGFGMSGDYSLAALHETVVDSPHYAAPEVIAGTASVATGVRVDVWSLGIMLYAMLCGRLPFIHTELDPLCHMIQAQEYSVPEHLPPSAVHLLHYMLQKNPAQRFDLAEVAIHAWTAGYDTMYPYKPAPPATRSTPPQRRINGTCPACGHASLRCPAPWQGLLAADGSLAPGSDAKSESSTHNADSTFAVATAAAAAAAEARQPLPAAAASAAAAANPALSGRLLRAIRMEMLDLGYPLADVERAAFDHQFCDDASATFDLLLTKYLREGLNTHSVPSVPDAVVEVDEVVAQSLESPSSSPSKPESEILRANRQALRAQHVRRKQALYLSVPEAPSPGADAVPATPFEVPSDVEAEVVEDAEAEAEREARHSDARGRALAFFGPVDVMARAARTAAASPTLSDDGTVLHGIDTGASNGRTRTVHSPATDSLTAEDEEGVPADPPVRLCSTPSPTGDDLLVATNDEGMPPAKRAKVPAAAGNGGSNMARFLFGRSVASLQRALTPASLSL